jgi:UDP-glucose 4-epimerase
MFKNKTLLITGGTGSFGNAVVSRLLQSPFKEIRIFSRDEKKQDAMRHHYDHPKLKFYVGDVRDPSSLKNVMGGVDFVFHSAALKQVPSCEFFPLEAVKTNIIGTDNVLTAAIEAQVKKVIVLSTDKAAYPINAMGMSKALAEKTAIARGRNLSPNQTIICLTRYGNVMGSRGSVIPLFLEQIKNKQPVTVTDETMTRFMMTLPMAVDLVMYAFKKGQQGDLLVQKAPAATVKTLVAALFAWLDKSSPVKHLGPRHGEKNHEVLVTKEEMAKAFDEGDYFRIPADNRQLNYAAYLSQGDKNITSAQEYGSHNTRQLDAPELVKLLEAMKCSQICEF